MKLILPTIYPITDTRISGVSHLEQCEKLIAGGARIIQLREKYASPDSFYESAKSVIKLAAGKGVRIIVNDRVDIALAVKAAGVHIGQEDMPPDKARSILGPEAIIGISTHSVEQALTALSMPIDYIAIGPIFATQTKDTSNAVVGLDGVRNVRNAAGDVPLVAIGGITLDNFEAVLAAGADSVAVISALISDPAKIESRTIEFRNQIKMRR